MKPNTLYHLFTCLALVMSTLLSSNAFSANPLTELNLTAQEKEWLMKHPVIRVSPDANYQPIEYLENGRHAGMSGDYFKLLSEMLDIEFRIVQHKSWSESLAAMDAGRIDILPLIQETPARAKKYHFTIPYIALNSVMITDKVPGEDFHNIESLKHKKLAVVKGYFWEELVRQDYPSIEIVQVNNIEEGLTETALGTSDAFLASLATSSHYISQQNITNLRVAGKSPYDINYGIAVRKDWPELISILNKAINAISVPQHEEIKGRWINLDFEPPIISRQMTQILFALIGLTTLLAAGTAIASRVLSRKVKEKTLALSKINHELEAIVEARTQDLRKANERLRESEKKLTSSNKSLTKAVNHDDLTNIPNRKKLNDFLTQTMKEALTNLEPVSVILADIDYFKRFNDHYGHLLGDDCLIEVANCLNDLTKRGQELVARFGGEEFIIVLPNTNEKDALKYAELVLSKIKALNIENLASPTEKNVTISLGVASMDPNVLTLTQTELIDRSDTALYRAKENGRNQAVTFSSLK